MSHTLKFVNGTLAIGSNGQPILIEGTEKTRQDLAQVQMDPYDSDRDWGSDINIGRTFGPLPGTENIIKDLVEEAVNRLIRYQQVDPNTTDDERIAQIVDIFVMRDPVEHLTFYYLLLVKVDTDEHVTDTMSVQLEQQVSLRRLFDVKVM